MLAQVNSSGRHPRPAGTIPAKSDFRILKADEQRGLAAPLSGRNPIPAWPARNGHRSLPQMRVCKLFSGVSNAEAESCDAWSQRSLKVQGGEKKSPRGVAGPQLGPSRSRRWMLSVGMLGHGAGARLPCWEE